jgi:uncharacterized protein
MNSAFIRFYEELNDFLPPLKRKILYPVHFRENPGIKSIIESEGIPHTEVDLILVNGRSVSFNEKIRPGDHVSVYPVFESFDISSLNMIRLKPLREAVFVLDIHLGKLAHYLRMLGFDSVYDNRFNDDQMIRIAKDEKRCILTRSRKLLMRKEVTRGYWVRGEMIPDQVAEVIRRFNLENSIRLFSICTLCNGKLQGASEETARMQYPEHKFYPDTVFYRCDNCFHIYWNGSHSRRFEDAITNRGNSNH